MERRKNLEKRASIDNAPRKHPLMKTKGVTQGRVGVDSIVGAGKETQQFGIFIASAQALGDALYPEESTIQELSKKFLGILRAEVFRDFKGRLAGLIKALTTGFQRLNNFISNVTLVLDHQISKFKDAGVWLDGNNVGDTSFAVLFCLSSWINSHLQGGVHAQQLDRELFEDCCVGAAVMVGLLKRFEECCDGAAVMVGLLPVEATTNFGVMVLKAVVCCEGFSPFCFL
ncbi:unnamed protein product [Ilex paraguariensis]|uniref:Uncharacterized protein n=1 Tax=Ilex paraguariensis TaxID=185542 RepID=A0ABC8TGQ2_9AQUA